MIGESHSPPIEPATEGSAGSEANTVSTVPHTQAQSSSPPHPKPRRSGLRVLVFGLTLIVVFVVVASVTALTIMARRGTIALPWAKGPTPTTSPSPAAPGGPSGQHRAPPTGSFGQGKGPGTTGTPGTQAGVFESRLGYKAEIPPGWQVAQSAQSGGGDSAFDSFTNGRDGADYASIQVLALEAPGIDVLQVSSQVAAKASTQQGYSIMVQPRRDKFKNFDAASFRAYTVQSGFPLVVEVYVVAGPGGRLIQVQFASSLEGFTPQSSALSTFKQNFEFTPG